MHRSIITRGAAAVLALAALAACDAPISAPNATEAPDELARQVEALGFRGDMVQDMGDHVLVEGDIYITKDELRRARPRSVDPLGPRFQYRTTNLVGSPKVHTITVDVSGLASQPGWQTAAREALTHWSGIANSYVRMVEGSPADITVSTTCTSSNVAASASFPSAGNPGNVIYVNTCFGYATSHAQKVHNMVHEFGHTLGFRHSNYTQLGESAGTAGAVHIWGTPTSGNATGSVMNGGTALNSWAGFSSHDGHAARSLYPLPLPGAPTVAQLAGYPQLSWQPVVGATGYDIVLVEHNDRYDYERGDYSQLDETVVGSTSGTSFHDTLSPWTGVSYCSFYDGPYGWERRSYYYYVRATFPTGSRGGYYTDAPVGTC